MEGGCEIRAYADDIVIVAHGEFKLAGVLTVVKDWCRRWRLEINKEKSGVMCIRKDRRTPDWCSQGTYRGYPVVASYKYLGITIEDTLTMDAMSKDMDKQIQFLRSRVVNHALREFDDGMELLLWQAYLKSKVQYSM